LVLLETYQDCRWHVYVPRRRITSSALQWLDLDDDGQYRQNLKSINNQKLLTDQQSITSITSSLKLTASLSLSTAAI